MKIKSGQICKASQKISENIETTEEGYINLRHLTSLDGKKGTSFNIQRPMFWYKCRYPKF